MREHINYNSPFIANLKRPHFSYTKKDATQKHDVLNRLFS